MQQQLLQHETTQQVPNLAGRLFRNINDIINPQLLGQNSTPNSGGQKQS